VTYKQQLGRRGEKIARRFLVERGYLIMETNFHTRDGEIDIIAFKDSKIYFVEVKTRTSDFFGGGEEAVDERKIEKLTLCAQKYIQIYNIDYMWQIDLISILIDEKNAKIKHIKNITF